MSREPVSSGAPRVSTGSTGLDTLLRGGWLRGGLYVVAGPPGTGKTILGNQSCFAEAARGGRAIYATLLAESHGRLVAHLQNFSFFRREAIGSGVQYVAGYGVLAKDGVDGLLRLLNRTVREQKATVLVVDGLSAAAEKAGSPLAFREFLHGLGVHGAMSNCTTLLLTTEASKGSEPEHAMVDGIIALTAELIGLKAVRGVEVLKLRGAAQMAGKHTFDITADGVTVYPRTEALYSRESPVVPDSTQRLTFGVKGFDDMLDGGLVAYSSTLIFGSPGSGKTSLCLSFLREGAERGESGLYFGFAESPERLIAKSKLVGTDLEPHVRSGVVALEARLPVETLPDALVQELLEKLERRKVRRLVIDGLEPFSRESLDPARTARFVSALTNVLRDRRITALFTQQTNTLFGPELHAPTQGVEAIIDNIVFLRYVELDANLRRLISILKMRESDNDSSLRELKISHRGLAVAEPFESAESILTGLARGVSRPRLTSPRRRRR